MLSTYYIHNHRCWQFNSPSMNDQQDSQEDDAPFQFVWTNDVYTTNLRSGKKTVEVGKLNGKVMKVSVSVSKKSKTKK